MAIKGDIRNVKFNARRPIRATVECFTEIAKLGKVFSKEEVIDEIKHSQLYLDNMLSNDDIVQIITKLKDKNIIK